MKRILIFTIFLSVAIGLHADGYKVIERSASSYPQWVGGSDPGAIISTAEGADISSCQATILKDIRERIAMSIATNVTSSESMALSHVSVNDKEENREEYHSQSSTTVAKFPFLKGISLTNVTDSYWEKRKNKSNGNITYFLAVRYPFSQHDLKTLVAQFEKLDAEKVAELNDLKQKVSNVTSINDIQQGLNQLAVLKEYFVDKEHLLQVDAMTKQYNNYLRQMSISTTFPNNKSCFCQLLFNGKPIAAGAAPKVTATHGIDRIDVQVKDDGYIITFDNYAGDFLDQDNSALTITFNVAGHQIRKKVHVEAASE